MSIRNEITPYLDKNGYANPYPVKPDSGRSSDNATMYTSEYYIMLQKQGQLSPEDVSNWTKLISDAETLTGLPARYPGYTDQDSPDNMVAIMSASQVLGISSVARGILKYGILHFGCFNNSDPGKFTFQAMTWRQPQLFAATVAASFPSKLNPLHYLVRLLAFPWFLYAAVCIAISCIGTDKNSTDQRRLSWHLIQAMKPVSLMCWAASKVWFKRLWNDYPKGMNDVAVIYYQPHDATNPYAKYWVT